MEVVGEPADLSELLDFQMNRLVITLNKKLTTNYSTLLILAIVILPIILTTSNNITCKLTPSGFCSVVFFFFSADGKVMCTNSSLSLSLLRLPNLHLPVILYEGRGHGGGGVRVSLEAVGKVRQEGRTGGMRWTLKGCVREDRGRDRDR